MSDKDREVFEQIVRLTHKLDGPWLRHCGLIDTPYTYADPNTEDAWQQFKAALTHSATALAEKDAEIAWLRQALEHATGELEYYGYKHTADKIRASTEKEIVS